MRGAIVFIPTILALLGSDAGFRLTPVSGGLSLQSVLIQSGDTGEASAGRLRLRAGAFWVLNDPLEGLRLECPMPVERPDPDASIPMPTRRDLAPRSATPPVAAAPAAVSRMPVVRTGCWNPLDQPRGDRDSTGIDGSPQPHQ
jgi:hypothetical protein